MKSHRLSIQSRISLLLKRRRRLAGHFWTCIPSPRHIRSNWDSKICHPRHKTKIHKTTLSEDEWRYDFQARTLDIHTNKTRFYSVPQQTVWFCFTFFCRLLSVNSGNTQSRLPLHGGNGYPGYPWDGGWHHDSWFVVDSVDPVLGRPIVLGTTKRYPKVAHVVFDQHQKLLSQIVRISGWSHSNIPSAKLT